MVAELTGKTPEELRESLLDQLSYLIDEVEMLQAIVDSLPESTLKGRVWEQELSIKEIYGTIALADEEVYLPQIIRVAREDKPEFPELDERALATRENWNDTPIRNILQRVASARKALYNTLAGLDIETWHRSGRWNDNEEDLFAFVYAIIQRDVQLLRTVSYRLHGSSLSDRNIPL